MSKIIEDQENIDFNYILFPTTHNSFSKKVFKEGKGTLEFQINSGISSFEFDIHDKDGEGNYIFSIGHLIPGDDVYNEDTNPSTIHLKDWLECLRDIVNDNLNRGTDTIKGPIVIWLDLKSLLTFNGPKNDVFAFNNLILDIFERNEKNLLFRPRKLIRKRVPWPNLNYFFSRYRFLSNFF